jgi:hypothetical protein
MIFYYLSFSFFIVFLSFIVGMIMTTLFRKTNFYKGKLSNLNFIKNETTNQIIGVGIVKWIVKNTFFKFFNQYIKFDRTVKIDELKFIRNEMTKSEIGHLFAFVFVLISIFITFCKQEYLFSFVIFFVNTIMNLYPSLLQQENKRRIDKILFKFENRKPTN